MAKGHNNSSSRIARLVWALTAVGLCAGAVTHGLEYVALKSIRKQRASVKEAEAAAFASIRRLQTAREFVVKELDIHFQKDGDGQPRSCHGPQVLVKLLEQCMADLSALDSETLNHKTSSDELTRAVQSLSALHRDVGEYQEQVWTTRSALNSAWADVRRSLAEMSAATQKLDGRRRLKREVLTRQYYDSDKAGRAEIAGRLIDELNTTGGFRTILSELSDMELLTQRLVTTDQIDQLISLKDNDMRQTLNRLFRACERADEQHQADFRTHVTSIQNAVFGRGSRDDPAHQTLAIGEAGLYSLKRQMLELEATEHRLRRALTECSVNCIEAERNLDRVLAAAIDDAALRAQKTLTETGRESIVVGVIVFATFIMLAAYIARIGKAAEWRLRQQNAELEATMEQLRIASQESQAANRAKSDFLANMSHEIRTPMTAILGFTDSLLDPELPDSKRIDAIQTIRRNGTHLLQIINDILDMSKIEAGKMEVERIDTSPAQIVEEVASLMQPRAHDKGLDVVVRYDTPVPERISSDPTRLRQVLLNLVGNSIKFTETGAVSVHAAYRPNAGCMEFRVVDTGLGMSPEQVEAIRRFDAFQQADSSTTRKFGGTGLGLRISNSLCQLLGGGIDIASRRGSGSTFTVTVATGDIVGVKLIQPECVADFAEKVLRREFETSGVSEAKRPLAGLRILVAEDGPDNQRLISHHLEKAGADVTLAANGQIAIELIDNRTDATRFHVVLMDMQMPELDGYSATRRLRRAGCEIPIIALTAHAMSGDRDKCLQAGCNDYLTKPLDKHNLLQKCHDWGLANADVTAS